jgi:hypothetical protein
MREGEVDGDGDGDSTAKPKATTLPCRHEPAFVKKKPHEHRPMDDPDFDPREIENAEFSEPTNGIAPELDERTVELTEWDEPPGSTGTAAPKSQLEDEVSAGEQLIEEGLDEADRDQRLAASDPDYEP